MSEAQLEIILTAQDATNKAFQSLTGHIKNITKEIFSFKGLLAGVATSYAGQQLAQSFLETGLAAERMNKSMESATGGAAQAASAYDFLNDQADRLGLQFETQISGFQKIAAAAQGTALEGEQVRKIYIGLSEASGAMQLKTEAVERVMTAVSQMMSKGKVSAEELRQQMGEHLPGAFRLAAEAMGVSTEELDKMMKDGKLFADDFLPKFAESLHKNYGKAAEDAAFTASAAINRLKNTWFEVQTTVMNADVMSAISDAVEQIQKDILGWVDANEELIRLNMAEYARLAAAGFSEFLSYLPAVIDTVETLGNLLYHLAQVVMAGYLMKALAGLPALWTAATNAVIAYNMSILTAHASSLMFSSVLGGLTVAAGVLMAAFSGWKIGQWLSEEFEAVRMAGIGMIDGLMKGWINFKAGVGTVWASVKYVASSTYSWMQKAAATAFKNIANAMKAVPSAMPGAELIKGYAVDVELLAMRLEKTAVATENYGTVLDKVAISYDQQINAHEAIIDSMLEEQTTYVSAERVVDDYIDIKSKQTDKEKGTRRAVDDTSAALNSMANVMNSAANTGAKSAQTLKKEWDKFLDPFGEVDKELSSFFGEIDKESQRISDRLKKEQEDRVAAYSQMYQDLGAAAEGYREHYVQELEKERDAFIKTTGDKEMAYIWFSDQMGELDKSVAEAQKAAAEESAGFWVSSFGEAMPGIKGAFEDLDGMLGEVTGSMKNSLSDNLFGFLSGELNSFSDLWDNVWDSVLNTFTDSISGMVVDWAVSGVSEMLGSALGFVGKEAASWIGDSFDLGDLLSFGTGAWDVKETMLAQLHEGEIVLPKEVAETFRDAFTGNEASVDRSPDGGWGGVSEGLSEGGFDPAGLSGAFGRGFGGYMGGVATGGLTSVATGSMSATDMLGGMLSGGVIGGAVMTGAARALTEAMGLYGTAATVGSYGVSIGSRLAGVPGMIGTLLGPMGALGADALADALGVREMESVRDAFEDSMGYFGGRRGFGQFAGYGQYSDPTRSGIMDRDSFEASAGVKGWGGYEGLGIGNPGSYGGDSGDSGGGGLGSGGLGSEGVGQGDDDGGGYCCFPAGTMILMADGTEKPIEDVKIGDRVTAWHEHFNTVISAAVMAVESPKRRHICEIDTLDGSVQVTDEHPFYADGKGWVSINPMKTRRDSGMNVQKMNPGDRLVMEGGRTARVEHIGKRFLPAGEFIQTYNLSCIEAAQTFYADGFLVHNKLKSGGIVKEAMVPDGEDGWVPLTLGEGVVSRKGMELLDAINSGSIGKTGGGSDQPIIIRVEVGGLVVDEFTIKKFSDEVRVEADRRGMKGRPIY